MAFLRKQTSEVMETMDNNIISSLLKLLWVVLKTYFEVEGIKKKPQELDRINIGLENLFLYAFTWSFCCTADLESRILWDNWLKSKLELLPTSSNVTYPRDRSFFDLEYSFLDNRWKEWSEKDKDYTVPQNLNFAEIVIPTLDYCRMKSLMSYGLLNKMHMLIVGQTGTGKSVDALSFLGTELSDRFTGMSVVLSA